MTETAHDEGVAGPWSWAVAWASAPGEVVSGDRHVVVDRGSSTVIAVIDALGHGPEAAAVAERAVHALAGTGSGADATALTRTCHAALEGTRGAVLTVAVHDRAAGSFEVIAVGNVEAALHGHDSVERSVNAPGIVGYQLPELRARSLHAAPGDVFVLVTDGIDAGFNAAVRSSPSSVRSAAARVFEEHRRGDDDALVLVARLDGDAR